MLKPLWANSEKCSSFNFEIPTSTNQYVACVLYHFRLPRSESVLGFTDSGDLGFGILLVSAGLFKVPLFTVGSFPTLLQTYNIILIYGIIFIIPPPPEPPGNRRFPVRTLRGAGGI